MAMNKAQSLNYSRFQAKIIPEDDGKNAYKHSYYV